MVNIEKYQTDFADAQYLSTISCKQLVSLSLGDSIEGKVCSTWKASIQTIGNLHQDSHRMHYTHIQFSDKRFQPGLL